LWLKYFVEYIASSFKNMYCFLQTRGWSEILDSLSETWCFLCHSFCKWKSCFRIAMDIEDHVFIYENNIFMKDQQKDSYFNMYSKKLCFMCGFYFLSFPLEQVTQLWKLKAFWYNTKHGNQTNISFIMNNLNTEIYVVLSCFSWCYATLLCRKMYLCITQQQCQLFQVTWRSLKEVIIINVKFWCSGDKKRVSSCYTIQGHIHWYKSLLCWR
jgi:hypothetical protein